jgi:hypothetical protein
MISLKTASNWPERSAELKISTDSTLGQARAAAAKALNVDLKEYQVHLTAFGEDVVQLTGGDDSKVKWKPKGYLYWIAPLGYLPIRQKKGVVEEKEPDDKFKGLTPENIFKKLASAKGQQKKIALEFLDEFTPEIIRTKQFLTVPKEAVAWIAARDSINVGEADLFDACVKWAQAEIKRKEKAESKESKEDIKTVLKDVIPHIRFPTMSTEDVATKVLLHGVLDESQVLELYTYLAQADMPGAKPGKALSVFKSEPRKGAGTIWKCVAPPESNPYAEPPTGVFHMIGTNGGKKSHSNPHTDGSIRMYIEPGTNWTGGISEQQLVDTLTSGRSNSTDCYLSGTWFAVDLKQYRWRPSHYSMRNGGGRGLVLRDWTIEAKVNDSDEWEVLRRYTNDPIYANDGQNGFGLHVFPIEEPYTKKWYKHIRMVRSDGKRSFYIHRWELYGQLKKLAK